MLPLAHATDGGGSIRIPASCCGVFGLKPSRGRIHLGGRSMPGDIGVQHCVSRSVRDSAVLMDLTEMKRSDAVLAPVGRVEGPGKKRLRIAFNTENYYGTEPDTDVKAATESVAQLCADMGHEIVPVKNPVEGRAFMEAFLTVWSSGPAHLVGLAKENGLDPEQVLEPWTTGLAAYFASKPDGAPRGGARPFRDGDGEDEGLHGGIRRLADAGARHHAAENGRAGPGRSLRHAL